MFCSLLQMNNIAIRMSNTCIKISLSHIIFNSIFYYVWHFLTKLIFHYTCYMYRSKAFNIYVISRFIDTCCVSLTSSGVWHHIWLTSENSLILLFKNNATWQSILHLIILLFSLIKGKKYSWTHRIKVTFPSRVQIPGLKEITIGEKKRNI